MKKRWSRLAREAKAMIRQYDLMRPGACVLVGVSGGADSVALLATLRELAPTLKIRLAVAHLNHGLRGKAGAKDAAFVQVLADAWGLPCRLGRAQVARRAKNRGISLEMAARDARYAFLVQSARLLRADAIAVAHTEDDQAETVMLKLARGAGVDGLGGMRPCRLLQGGTRLVRPFLATRRRTLEAYLTANGLSWREDASNAMKNCLRNIVRHDVLPLLEDVLNPNIRAVLARTATVCRADADGLQIQARELLMSCQAASVGHASTVGKVPPCRIRVSPLLDALPARRWRALRLWLLDGGVSAARLDFDAVARIERLMQRRQGGGQVAVGEGWMVSRMAGWLSLDKQTEAGREAVAVGSLVSRKISVPGTTVWRKHGWRITVRRSNTLYRDCSGLGQWPACASLNLAKLAGRELRLRFWRLGDRMRPMGLKGSKKLQDIFTNTKAPRAIRAIIPLFECEGEIVWLPGYRVAQGWGMGPEDDACWRIRIEPLDPVAAKSSVRSSRNQT